jgi:hypothetical protein
MLDLARHAGEDRLALVLPISVDGLVVAGSTTSHGFEPNG